MHFKLFRNKKSVMFCFSVENEKEEWESVYPVEILAELEDSKPTEFESLVKLLGLKKKFFVRMKSSWDKELFDLKVCVHIFAKGFFMHYIKIIQGAVKITLIYSNIIFRSNVKGN